MGAGPGLLEAQLARKGALGLGGSEFALQVIGERDCYCSRSVRTGSRFWAKF